MKIENFIKLLKDNQRLHNISGSWDPELFYKELGLDEAGLTFLFCRIYLIFYREVEQLKHRICELEQENEVLQKTINSHIQNERTKQAALVQNGLPIAKRKRKNLFILDGDIKLGYTDEEIMDHFHISRVTLWRWKKELQELKKQKKSLF